MSFVLVGAWLFKQALGGGGQQYNGELKTAFGNQEILILTVTEVLEYLDTCYLIV